MKTRFMTLSALLPALVLWGTLAWAKAEDGSSDAQETAKQAPGPRLVISETHFNFEKVSEGERISHEFKVWNEGSEPLRIISVRPD